MLTLGDDPPAMNEQTIDLIAERVAAALRDDLDAIAARLTAPQRTTEQLTVEQVARRLGVARSTVYAHWREWGGHKLGGSKKAPIRFDSVALPIVGVSPTPRPPVAGSPRPMRARKTPHRNLLVDAPRFAQPLDSVASLHAPSEDDSDNP